MPLPNDKDVGHQIKFLNKEHKKFAPGQKLAIALSQARKSGADIPKPKHAKSSY